MAGECKPQGAGHEQAILHDATKPGLKEQTREALGGRILNMLECHKIRNEAESQRVDLDGLEVDNARTIENLLRRAHEIHRQHGGILGYDLEDWLQAEKELAEEHRTTFRRGHSVPVEVEISR
jgi:hypothetical protein